MGYNTTVVLLNDNLEQIAKDQDFGKNLATAVLHSFGGLEKPISVPSIGCSPAAQIIEMHHADEVAVVAVGGNTGAKIKTIYGYPLLNIRDNDERSLKILKTVADSLGYRLVKKPNA